MAAKGFPHPQGMTSFWRLEPKELDNHRSTEHLPKESDIVIIGAGWSGAALSTHLLRHVQETGSSRSILVLEARQLYSSATGRNGGHVKPDSYNEPGRIEKLYGMEAAAEIANFEAANLEAVADLVREEQIDCDFVRTRAIDVQFDPEHQKELRQGYDKLAAAGVDATKRTFVAPDEYAEQLSGIKGAKGMFTYPAAHVWPYKLMHHLFSKVIQQGVNVQTNTPVTDISSQPESDGRWVIKTPRGEVRARKIIMSTNSYTAALLPEYSGKIIPYRGVCSHIKTPGPAPYLPNTYSLRFSDSDFDYLIPRADGSIVLGGAHRTYIKDTKDWYGNTNDSQMMEQARKYFDGYMQRHFRGWEESGAYVSEIWTGIMGFSSDGIPRVGPIPKRPGIFIMGGFNGHGMPQIYLCAKAVSQMVFEDKPFSSTSLPRLFEESEKRLQDKTDLVKETADKLIAKCKL